MCIGSIDELMRFAEITERPTDLHPEFINKIIIISPTTGKKLYRIPEVFDCWFESGSVPYGQLHYPFENEHIFDNREYLSDFVCEGIDQTRGWFYTLNVLSTALFDKPAFRNVICAGLILDKEGKKMSKRNGNFKDPLEIIEKYGSDPMRMYLLGSSVVQAENLNFDEDNIMIVKQKLIQWHNCVHFFIEHYLAYVKQGHIFDCHSFNKSENIFDKWIIAKTRKFIHEMTNKLDQYDLPTCVHLIFEFIENFANWYLKLNRNRMKGINSLKEWGESLSTACYSIMNAIKCMTPFTPFLSEYIYQNIKNLDENPQETIHMCKYPNVNVEMCTFDILLENMEIFKNVLTNARALRSKKSEIASIRKPIKKLYIAHDNVQFLEFIGSFTDILMDEVNCMDIEISQTNKFISYKIKPNMKEIAKKYKQKMKSMKEILGTIPQNILSEFYDKKITTIMHDNMIFTQNEIEVIPEVSTTYDTNIISIMVNNLIIAIDTSYDEKLLEKYISRQFCMAVQNLRKECDIHPWDVIAIGYDTEKCLYHMYKNEENTLKLKCQIHSIDCHHINTWKMIIEKRCEMYGFDGNVYDRVTIKLVQSEK